MRHCGIKKLILLGITACVMGSASAFAAEAAATPGRGGAPAQPAVTPTAKPATPQPPMVSTAAPAVPAVKETEVATTTVASPVIATETVKAGPDYSNPLVPISGFVLMPTSYRGRGLNTIGISLDMNAAYYIGRIYGKNSYNWTLNQKNYLDRIGQWMLAADGKMLIQTEDTWRPAIAAGVMGMFTFRDSGQPKLDDPTVSVKVNSSQGLASAYINTSKRFFNNRLITTAGYMEGTIGNIFPLLSEFLTDEAISLSGHPGQTANSRSIMYGGMLFLITPSFPMGFEIIVPQGAALNPKLVNLHLGSLLKMNFELSYLSFDGGWDALGMIQFRYTFFPK